MIAKLPASVRNFLVREDGPTTVEYAVLLALMVGMMISAIIYVGDQASLTADKVVDAMDGALNNGP